MTYRSVRSAAVMSAAVLMLGPLARPQDAASIFQVVPTPNPQGYSGNDLYAAAASGPNDIWAVGLSAIHYDGTTWTGYSLPGRWRHRPSDEGRRRSLPTNAWAVGSYAASPTSNGDILHWDGTAWTPFPNAAGEDYYLVSIAAISDNDIWAGGCIPAGFNHFDGTQWSWVPSAGGGGEDGESCIQGISALATNDVWAVGWVLTGGTVDSTQIQHWDGTRWTVTPSPNVGAGSNQLYGVVALADNDVWAVGTYISQPPNGIEYPNHTLIEHWDGTSWTFVSSPNNRFGGYPRDNILQGVVAVSSNDVWAYGSVDSNPGPGSPALLITLVLHWDGTSWTIAPSPNPARDPSIIVNQLYGGVVSAPGSIWLVGSQELAPGRGNGTLVLHTTGG